jgi:hypothetical protein
LYFFIVQANAAGDAFSAAQKNDPQSAKLETN